MRLYTFTNFYLSSIQQGIQPAHAAVELFVKYDFECAERTILMEWAEKHKTMICLNGGNLEELKNIRHKLSSYAREATLHFVYFCEDDQSLGGMLTSVAVVLPARLYGTAELVRTRRVDPTEALIMYLSEHFQETSYQPLSDAEVGLIELINNYGLAK